MAGVAAMGVGASAQAASEFPKIAKPVITSIYAPHHWVAGIGERITVIVHVKRAKGCTFYGLPTRARSYACQRGRVAITITYDANPKRTWRSLPTKVVVSATGGKTVTKSLGLKQYGNPAGGNVAPTKVSKPTTTPAPTPAVSMVPAILAPYLNYGLGCANGEPHCYLGPISNTYSDYGNHAPDGLGDCAFAAVAYWEQIVLNITPDPAVIGYQFAAAGGTAQGGITQTAVWNYWEKYGIGGSVQTGLQTFNTDQTNVESAVRAYGAMIVTMQVKAGDYLGQFRFATTGGHDVVVDGYTPEGPLVVTWGQTVQMTWQQWSALVTGVYTISAHAV
jgi:hypothetical protein